MQARAIVLLVFVGLGAGGGSETARHAEAIVYTIGLSTDPYGNPSPDGFGVVTAPLRRPLAKVEVRDRRYGWSEGAAWLDRTRILVPRRDLRRLFFRYRTGHLEPGGSAPLPAPVWTFAWSRDRRLLAVEPAARCDRKQPLRRCFKASHRIFVSRADGSRRRLAVRGELGGWTPKAELIYSPSAVETRYLALDLVTRHRTTLPRSLAGAPIWSGDGRYFTGTISMPRRRPRVSGAFSIWQSDGELLQTVTSRYAISMVAWSPRGRRLAYTTSG